MNNADRAPHRHYINCFSFYFLLVIVQALKPFPIKYMSNILLRYPRIPTTRSLEDLGISYRLAPLFLLFGNADTTNSFASTGVALRVFPCI